MVRLTLLQDVHEPCIFLNLSLLFPLSIYSPFLKSSLNQGYSFLVIHNKRKILLDLLSLFICKHLDTQHIRYH